MGSEIPAERMMPGNVNAFPQCKLRGDVLFLFNEGVSITNRVGVSGVLVFGLFVFFLINLGMSSVIYVTDQFFRLLFLLVILLLCLLGFFCGSPLNGVFGTANTPNYHTLSSVLQSFTLFSLADEARESCAGIHCKALHWTRYGGWSRYSTFTLLPTLPLPTACHSQPLYTAK